MLLSTRDKIFCSLIVGRLSSKEVNFCCVPKAILLVASPEVSLFSASFLFGQWNMVLSFAGIKYLLVWRKLWNLLKPRSVKESAVGEIEIPFWKY